MPSVYVVDSDEAVRDSLQILLETYGYHVRSYGTRSSFLANVPGDGQGCVLIDWHEPMTFKQITARPILPQEWDMPIVLMKANLPPAEFTLPVNGVVGLLDKPIALDSLLNVLGQALPRAAPSPSVVGNYV
ncbi:MAG: hypothetical protein ACFB3T_03775 [Geminicoccaceae bacterium]